MYLMLNIKQGASNLLSSKLRSFLAVLGIMIGTASVVAMVSCGQLASEAALEQFKSLGTNLLSVSIYEESSGGDKHNLSIEDFHDHPATDPDIELASPYILVYQSTFYDSTSIQASIIGVTEPLAKVIKIELEDGRFISFMDDYEYFCVVGSKVAQQMREAGSLNPIGSQLRVGSAYYTVVGVAKEWPENSFFNEDINKSILVPIKTASVLSSYAKISNVILRINEEADIPALQKRIEGYFNQLAPGSRLFFHSAQQIVDSMSSQSQIFTALLALIGSISLLVGGVGVMNIMLVSVVERRREIGIRLALGAERADIQALFLIEAIGLTFSGGICGVVLGVTTAYVITLFTGWSFHIFWLPPLIGFSVSVAIGLFFGFYPAYQASRLDPIQTLRVD